MLRRSLKIIEKKKISSISLKFLSREQFADEGSTHQNSFRMKVEMNFVLLLMQLIVII